MKRHSVLYNETGAAMVIALMTLTLLTMAVVLFIAQTKTETQISGHDMRSTQALYNAEAGYAEMLARLSDERDAENYIGQAQGGWVAEPGWGRYLVLGDGNSADDPDRSATEMDGLDNNGDGNIDEGGENYPEVKTKQAGEDIVNYPWVSVHYKLNTTSQVILFGDHDSDLLTPPQPNIITGYPMIVVTANGGQGSADRTIEVEAVKQPFEVLNTAAYSEDDDFKFNGTQFLVSGADWDPVTETVIAGNPEVPGLLTTADPDNITDELSGAQENNVEGTGAEPSVQSTTIDLDLEALRESFIGLAEYVVPAGAYDDVSWGDYDNYTVVHCTGDLQLSGNGMGGGVLVVDGNLKIAGQFTWYGVVLVMGDVELTGGGAGVHIYGATLAEGDLTISGNADLLYSSLALSRLAALSPYVVFNWREVN